MKTWEALYDECRSCEKCSLSATRTNCVFGAGNPNADVLFVGEAPGEKEDLAGAPFVGAAGKLLDKFFAEAGISRDKVYITNILKCRPPKNRDPLPTEEDACLDFLRDQVRLINPKIIVCLGRVAAKRLIRPDYMITREHGQWVKHGNFLMTAVYHPALLLRDPRKNDEMLADMKKIKEVIGD